MNSVADNDTSIQIFVWVLRAVILGTSVWALMLMSWQLFFLGLLAYVLTFIPEFIEYKFKTILPVEFDFLIALFIFLSVFLGEVGDAYERFFWWDALLHLTSSFMLGYIAFLWLYIQIYRGKINTSSGIYGFIIFSVAVALGVLWEIFEFAMDQWFGLNMQKSGLVDTMWDLIVNSFGAALIAGIGTVYMRHGGVGFIRRWTHKFMSQNNVFSQRQ